MLYLEQTRTTTNYKKATSNMTTEYQKLTPSSETRGDGQFVKTLQGQFGEGVQGGTHVHKDWWAKTLSYDDVMNKVQHDIDNRNDIMIPAKNIIFNMNKDNALCITTPQGQQFIPTDWALQQLSTRMDAPSASALREMRNQQGYDKQDGELMVEYCNNYFRRVKDKNPTKEYRLRTYNDGTCRAFVTDKYSPINNIWFLECLKEFLPQARFSHWKGDEDTLMGNLLLPDTIMDYGQDDDTDYGGMVSISNCEIGKRRISQYPSIFRAICMNGCIWGQQKGTDVNRVHRGTIDLDALKVALAENIEFQLSILPDGIRKFLDTRSKEFDVKFTSHKGIVAAVASEFRLDKRLATNTLEQFVKHEFEHHNLFGVINSLTRAGQNFDNNTWVNVDTIGGKLMTMTASRWHNLQAKAQSMTDKDFEKAFSLTA